MTVEKILLMIAGRQTFPFFPKNKPATAAITERGIHSASLPFREIKPLLRSSGGATYGSPGQVRAANAARSSLQLKTHPFPAQPGEQSEYIGTSQLLKTTDCFFTNSSPPQSLYVSELFPPLRLTPPGNKPPAPACHPRGQTRFLCSRRTDWPGRICCKCSPRPHRHGVCSPS